MLPPAPPRFSITTFWPSAAPSSSPSARAMTSGEPPAANGTTSVIGFVGQDCACADAGCSAAADQRRQRTIDMPEHHILSVSETCPRSRPSRRSRRSILYSSKPTPLPMKLTSPCASFAEHVLHGAHRMHQQRDAVDRDFEAHVGEFGRASGSACGRPPACSPSAARRISCPISSSSATSCGDSMKMPSAPAAR